MQLATDGFSEANTIGQGGYGKVYRGIAAAVDLSRLDDEEGVLLLDHVSPLIFDNPPHFCLSHSVSDKEVAETEE
ncbi:hypothetical protein M569_16295, partial [Genlisea aurea]